MDYGRLQEVYLPGDGAALHSDVLFERPSAPENIKIIKGFESCSINYKLAKCVLIKIIMLSLNVWKGLASVDI